MKTITLNKEKIEATLQLFNAIEVNDITDMKTNESLVLKRCIRNGYILHPSIDPSDDLFDIIENIVGISGEKANSSFHKSWKIIQDTPDEELYIQQILHYITTYGFKAVGIFSDSTVYIPTEKLKVPKTKVDKIPLVVIKAYTKEKILENIIKLGSGIALHNDTLKAIMVIVENSKYDKSFISKIKNRELNSKLKDFYNIIPTEPVEYLRYLISKLTNESLIIKNKYLIEKIKEADQKFLDTMIVTAPPNLGTIFYRYKSLFLAMKKLSKNKYFFNALRRDAVKMHKPLPVDFLNDVTNRIKKNTLNFNDFNNKIESTTIFRKIRLAYALQHRLNLNNESIVYTVRNGKGYATDFKWELKNNEVTKDALELVQDSIIRDISKNVKDKTIYIPKRIKYALPATEKKFVGNVPTGSYVSVKEDMVMGIHWYDVDHNSIDLDISLLSITGKIGWDARYKSEGKDILFSGDLTSAPKPNGASELFYIKNGIQKAQLVMVNYYNYNKEIPVPTKILVAKTKPKNATKSYMVDPNNIIISANIIIEQKQNVLGLLVYKNNKTRFYFANASMGKSISSSNNEKTTHTRNYLVDSLINTISLNKILKNAGANIINEKPLPDKNNETIEYIDLSPEVLDKTTILNLIQPNNNEKIHIET